MYYFGVKGHHMAFHVQLLKYLGKACDMWD